MTTLLWIVGIAIVVMLVARRFMIPSLDAPIAETREQGDIEPLVAAIEELKPSARPTAYNHAIRKLWDSYERPLAIELVKVLAANHTGALISQYWIKQVLQVEPQLARAQISQKFLKTYYQPEVAASCGPVG